jgi:hypothetical protein
MRGRTPVYGAALVRLLESRVDFIPVVRTAVLDLGVTPAVRALDAVDAFLQWFSLVPISNRIGHYVMLRGDVDRIWHAMILNTALYRQVCRRYMGGFIDHHSNSGCPRAGWVLETVSLLESEFEANLHQAFREWRATALRESTSDSAQEPQLDARVRPRAGRRRAQPASLSRHSH